MVVSYLSTAPERVFFWQGVERDPGNAHGAPRRAEKRDGISFGFDEALHPFQGCAKEKARPLERAEEIGNRGEGAVLDIGVVNGRASRLKDAPMDLGHLQMGIDFPLDADEITVALEVVDALFKGLVSHNGIVYCMLLCLATRIDLIARRNEP